MRDRQTRTRERSPLEKAVDETDDVRGGFRVGLGAVKGCYRRKIVVPDSYKLSGSLDIDAMTEKTYPAENRWDYAVEYDNETFFIEIHPAITSEIPKIVAKSEWLRRWLKDKAPAINALKPKNKRPYYWVSTEKCAILPTSSHYKKLSGMGLLPIRQWNYSEL